MNYKKKLDDKISETLLNDYNKLYRLAYSYAGNPDDAMDIVQESAYKMMKSKKQIRQEDYIATWMYRIVINTSLDFLKKRKREVVGVEDYMKEYEDHYPDLDVRNSLSVLEEKDRAVIILRYFEDMKLSDIAGILDENTNTIKSRLYRALKKLKITMENMEV